MRLSLFLSLSYLGYLSHLRNQYSVSLSVSKKREETRRERRREDRMRETPPESLSTERESSLLLQRSELRDGAQRSELTVRNNSRHSSAEKTVPLLQLMALRAGIRLDNHAWHA